MFYQSAKMRLLIFTLLCVFSILSTSQARSKESDEFDAALKACLKETSLTKKDVYRKYNSSAEIPEQVLCFSICFYTKTGLLDEDGKIAENVLIKWFYEEIEEDEFNEFLECTREIGVVSECKDILQLEDCFDDILYEVDAAAEACMKNNSLTENDVFQEFNSTAEIPEPVLCYEKCYLTKLGFLDENGKILENLYTTSLFKELEKDELKEVIECTKKIGVISECKDILKLEYCFESFETSDED